MGTSPSHPSQHAHEEQELREFRLCQHLLHELKSVGSLERALHIALRDLVAAFGAADGVVFAAGRGDTLRIVHRIGAREWDPEVVRGILATGRATVSPDILYLTLRERGKPIAVLLLHRSTPFPRTDLRMLLRAGTLVDESLDTLAESRVVDVLARIERKIASELRTLDLLYQVLDGLRFLVRYDHSGSILLVDRERSRLVVRADKVVWQKMKSPYVQKTLDVELEIMDLLRVRDRAFLLSGDSGKCSAQPLDAGADAASLQVAPTHLRRLYDLLCDSCRSDVGPQEASMLVVPLIFGERLLGVLKLSDVGVAAFTPADVAVVGRFVEKMSTAIRNADLYERRLDELRAINEIGQLVTKPLPLVEICSRILEIVLGVLRLPVGCIELLDRDKGRLREIASMGYTVGSPGLAIGEGITGEVARTGLPIVANDVTTHPKYVLHTAATLSELAVPIRFESTVLGVLNVESFTPNRFRERDAEFLAILADKTAIALETLQQRERQQSTLHLLYELSGRLAALEEAPKLLQLTVDLTREHLNCEAAAVFLFEDGRYRRRATAGVPADWFAEESYSTGEGLTGRAAVLRSGPVPHPVVHNDVDRSGHISHVAQKRYAAQLGTGRTAHLIAVPLLENHRPIGILRVLNRLTQDGSLAAGGFTQPDVELLSAIASQVSLAMADLRKRERIQHMRVRLEEQVRRRTEEVQRLATFVENAPLAVFWIDTNGDLQFVNEAGEETFGYPAEELRGRRVDARGSDILGDQYESLAQVVGFMGLWNGELECRRSNGSAFPVYLSARELRDAGGVAQGMVVFVRDATSIKELERQLIASEGKRAMADLAGGVAHDVNNALGASLPMIQALRADVEEDDFDRDRFLEDLAQIESYTRISVRIFQGMLAMARGTFSIDKVVNINKSVATALDLVSFKLDKANVTVQRQLAENLPPVLAHPGRLEQAFHNLILNAIDAMPDGGMLVARSFADSERVVVEIEDSGNGIPQELLARVQEPFYTSKRHGTGLGLSVVRSIAWEHNGKTSLRSKVGVGTTVQMEFPVYRPSAAREEDAE